MRAWAAALLLAPAVGLAGGPPLDEIRQAFVRHGLHAPDGAALEGLVASGLAEGLRRIDPHARWFPAADYAREQADDAGVGVGAALARWGERLVLAPYGEGALARQGVTAPVALASIDGKPVASLSLREAAGRLAGAPGSTVRLALAAGEGGAVRDLTVAREPYRALSVESAAEVGHPVIRVRGFVTRETRTLLALAVQGLPGGRGPLVLDLRDCPGGDLFEALDSAGLFLPEGTPLGETRDRGGRRQVYAAPGGTKVWVGSVVLWVGPGTASAGEVFAGVLRHHGAARLVGERTFGKCSSQTDLRLSDGSVLRLTNREVVLPGGESCSGAGLEPDSPVGREGLLDGAALLRLSGGHSGFSNTSNAH